MPFNVTCGRQVWLRAMLARAADAPASVPSRLAEIQEIAPGCRSKTREPKCACLCHLATHEDFGSLLLETSAPAQKQYIHADESRLPLRQSSATRRVARTIDLE